MHKVHKIHVGVTARDQGWGNTASAYVALALLDGGGGAGRGVGGGGGRGREAVVNEVKEEDAGEGEGGGKLKVGDSCRKQDRGKGAGELGVVTFVHPVSGKVRVTTHGGVALKLQSPDNFTAAPAAPPAGGAAGAGAGAAAADGSNGGGGGGGGDGGDGADGGGGGGDGGGGNPLVGRGVFSDSAVSSLTEDEQRGVHVSSCNTPCYDTRSNHTVLDGDAPLCYDSVTDGMYSVACWFQIPSSSLDDLSSEAFDNVLVRSKPHYF